MHSPQLKSRETKNFNLRRRSLVLEEVGAVHPRDRTSVSWHGRGPGQWVMYSSRNDSWFTVGRRQPQLLDRQIYTCHVNRDESLRSTDHSPAVLLYRLPSSLPLSCHACYMVPLTQSVFLQSSSLASSPSSTVRTMLQWICTITRRGFPRLSGPSYRVLCSNLMVCSCSDRDTAYTRNSSGDEMANVNFLYDDIVHALKIQ